MNFRSKLWTTEKKYILGALNCIFKLSTGLRLLKIMVILAYAHVLKCFKIIDLDLNKGVLQLALKCCLGQRLLYLFCKSK